MSCVPCWYEQGTARTLTLALRASEISKRLNGARETGERWPCTLAVEATGGLQETADWKRLPRLIRTLVSQHSTSATEMVNRCDI